MALVRETAGQIRGAKRSSFVNHCVVNTENFSSLIVRKVTQKSNIMEYKHLISGSYQSCIDYSSISVGYFTHTDSPWPYFSTIYNISLNFMYSYFTKVDSSHRLYFFWFIGVICNSDELKATLFFSIEPGICKFNHYLYYIYELLFSYNVSEYSPDGNFLLDAIRGFIFSHFDLIHCEKNSTMIGINYSKCTI